MALKFYKVTSLPGTLEPDSFYFVENSSYAESYITNSAGVAKSIGNTAMINALISAALADWEAAANMVEIVADITARDALIATLERNAMILVIDASDDVTVDSGAALYAYDATADETYKIAEYESMDVQVAWSAIQGGPTSSPAQIDTAVSQSHTHTNKTVLDDLSDSSGSLNYKGAPITTDWASKDW